MTTPRGPASGRMLVLRAVAAFLVLPGVFAGVVPFMLWRGQPMVHPPWLPGLVPLGLGLVVLLWCVAEFFVVGRGTLAPWDPPRHLVVRGLYRLSRNPMYVGVLLVVAGWALLSRSATLGVYAVLLAVGFHLRVVYAEEPALARQFGDEFAAYRRAVPRWFGRRARSAP